MMPTDIVNELDAEYGDIEAIKKPLRSDENMLTSLEVNKMLKSNKIL
jgi:hypothetical protein